MGWTEALRELGVHTITYNTADRLTFYDSALLEVGSDDDGRVAIRKALTSVQATELAMNGLYAALYKTRPDVLLSVSGFFLEPPLMDLARSYGTKVVVLHTESPYEDERQLRLAAHADVNLVNDPTNIERYAEHGIARYVPHAYRPSLHRPGPADPKLTADLAFVGTGYPSRVAYFEAMDLDGLDVLLAGNWQILTEDSPLRKHVGHDIADCLDNEQAAEIYRSAKAGINLYRREAERPELSAGMAMGPREVEMAACGQFFLRDPRAEGDHVLSMLPVVTSPEEASEQVRWWLAHPSQRAAAAERAREAVADRTFLNHAKGLLRLLQS